MRERPARYQGQTLHEWVRDLESRDAALSNRASVVVSAQILPNLTNQMFQDTRESELQLHLIGFFNLLPGVELQYMPARYRRAAAAHHVGDFGRLAQPAVPALLRALKDADSVMRNRAAASLGRVHTEPGIVIPALVACLNDRSSEVRSAAAEALGGWGSEARAAVPRLVELLDDRSDRDLMDAVREALREIDPEAAAKAGLKVPGVGDAVR